MGLKNITLEQLIEKEQEREKARLQIILEHLHGGVVFIDTKNTYIDEGVSIGQGTVIWPGVIIEGNTTIGKDCRIGPQSRITDCEIGDNTEIQYSVMVESSAGSHTNIGPFAYLRPGSKIGNNAKVGDFVEVKNSTMGDGSKASHLTYIGDSDIGEGVNLGCGVVFVNYDGSSKHRSVIEDGAFIGCNTNIVSPVTVGKGAYVAAGTTVTKDVPEGALCVGRAKERSVEGWVEKRGLLKRKKK